MKCSDVFVGIKVLRGLEIDGKNQKVIVKGEKTDPIKVAERLRKNIGKHVELIHPKLLIQEKDKQKLEVIEVVLKINMDCNGCAKEVEYYIHDMEGVQRVDVDVEKNLVRVKGSMDPFKLVEFVSNRGERYAEIVKQTEANIGEGEGDCCYCYCYASQQVYVGKKSLHRIEEQLVD